MTGATSLTPGRSGVTVTFVGSGDAFGSGARCQACIHVRAPGAAPVLLDCGATSLLALKRLGLQPNELGAVLVSHLHGDHFGGLPFLVLDGQFGGRVDPLVVAGPPGLGDRLRGAMECLFPGSAGAERRFAVEVAELVPGAWAEVTGIPVRAVEVAHPSGAPPLALRLEWPGFALAYTGDTSWTDALGPLSDGCDLLVAEAYTYDRAIRHHLAHRDLLAHRHELGAARVVLTHCGPDMLGHLAESAFEVAHDGLVLEF